jgi:hypothetical protein
MRRTLSLAVVALTALVTAPAYGVLVGAHWSFQSSTSAAASDANFGLAPSFAVSAHSFPVAPGALTATSSKITRSFSSPLPSTFSNFAGTLYSPGPNLGFDTVSSSNSFTVNLDTTGVEDLAVRFSYRITTGGQTNYSAAYAINGGSPVPLTGLPTLTANSGWLNWSYDLSSISALDNAGPVALIFSLPLTPANVTLRVDNVQVTAALIPEPAALALLTPALPLLSRRRR